MAKLFGICVTKDNDLLIAPWLAQHARLFDKLVVVDGSVSPFTRQCAEAYDNVIYCRDPQGLITDQTLRHRAWVEIAKEAELGDWVLTCHPDEFLIHNPRDFMSSPAHVLYWMPLLVMPHPSEAEAWIRSKTKYPSEIFKTFWWRENKLPHVEHRMWRYFKEPEWNILLEKKSSTVIPMNYHDCQIGNVLPLYFHYKIYDFNINIYGDDGIFLNSGLNTGMPHSDDGSARTFKSFDDFFFYSERPVEEGYFNYSNDHSIITKKFGNPPMIINNNGKIDIVNNDNVSIVSHLPPT